MKYYILFLFLAVTAKAAVLEKAANGNFILKSEYKSSELLHDYAKLEKLNLTLPVDFQDETFVSNGSVEIKKENIESFVSSVLYLSGNTMLKYPEAPFIRIINSRDSRYTSTPVYTEIKDVPNNDSLVLFSMALKYADTSDVAWNLRPFLSRYGRVIDSVDSNSIHLSDTGRQVRKLVEVIQFIDNEEYVKSKKEIDEINEKHKKVTTSQKSFMTILNENNGLFVILFMLIGLILGFGVRGYFMKRVEGGW